MFGQIRLQEYIKEDAKVPFPLGFSTPDSHPSLKDQAPDFPIRRRTFVRRPQSPLRVRVRVFRKPSVRVVNLLTEGAGVVLSSSSLAR